MRVAPWPGQALTTMSWLEMQGHISVCYSRASEFELLASQRYAVCNLWTTACQDDLASRRIMKVFLNQQSLLRSDVPEFALFYPPSRLAIARQGEKLLSR